MSDAQLPVLKKANKSNVQLVKLLFLTAMDMEYPRAIIKRKATEKAADIVKQLDASGACAEIGVITPTADIIMEWLKSLSTAREKKRPASKTRVRARDRTPLAHFPPRVAGLASLTPRRARACALARARCADGRGRRPDGRRG